MDYNFSTGQRLILELKNSETFEGTYQSGNKDRIDVNEIIQYLTGNHLKGMLSFYRNEISSVSVLNAKETTEISNVKSKPIEQTELNAILLSKIEYNRLRNLYQEYEYIESMGQDYLNAVEDLNRYENIGVVAIGAEYGQRQPINLLVLASWNKVYIFDIQFFHKRDIPIDLKVILECNYIKKVVHNSKTLVNCLWHCHNTKLSNIFDTHIADVTIENNEPGTSKTDVSRTISQCLNLYLNFPNIIDKETRIVSLKDWEERPLSDSCKINAALMATYLITLKNKLEEIMLKPFYDAVHIYTKIVPKYDVKFEEHLNGTST